MAPDRTTSRARPRSTAAPTLQCRHLDPVGDGGPSGYTASAWICVGGTQDRHATITVGLGDEATCTITNDDIAPKLHLRKTVTNDNGGTARPPTGR